MAICFGLGLTLLVFVLLPEYRERLAPEQAPLLKGLAWAIVLAVMASGSFVAELRSLPRRRVWQSGLVAATAAVVALYWPR